MLLKQFFMSFKSKTNHKTTFNSIEKKYKTYENNNI